MVGHSIEPRARKYVKGYRFLLFAASLSNKYGKQLMVTATERELNALITASRKVVHKTAEATGEFIGSKVSDKIVKPKHVPDENSRNAEEIITPPEKGEEILNELRQV